MDPVKDTYSKEHFPVNKACDSCGVDYTKSVPHSRDADGFCTTECVSEDWSTDVKQENLAVLKREPDDVCYVIYLPLLFELFLLVC